MKGLLLCERYYEVYGARMIREKFPAYQHRIAVGLVGDGSECYGFDDEISRDHDWGPGFCLWLDDSDYFDIGRDLQSEYEKLPKTFEGYARIMSQWGAGRVGVFEIGAFYKKFIGLSHAPEKLMEWFYIPENYLSACTNGKVFKDSLGKFSQIRKKILGFYPEDVRLAKIATRCMSSAQAGQYNFMRSLRRRAYYAAQYAEAKFCADIISLVFLLNRQYTPFYKWCHQAVRNLPFLGEFLYEKIHNLIKNSDAMKKNDLIEKICAEVIKGLQQKGLSNSKSNFLLDHGQSVCEKIDNENLRKRVSLVG